MRRLTLLSLLIACGAWSTILHGALVWREGEGWSIEGGALQPLYGDVAEVSTAMDAMNLARENQEKGNYWAALTMYNRVINDYPNSVFAPEALYQQGLIYRERHQFERANKSFNQIVSRYPDYERFNQVIAAQFKVGSDLMDGERPYYWGIIPGFRDREGSLIVFEDLIKNAPFSEYAPLALMNIALTARDSSKPEESIDALDRLINTYPDSFLAADGYIEMGDTYASLVEGPWYDQGATQEAVGYYEDFLILYRDAPNATVARERLHATRDTLARSRFLIGDFYYRYRNNPRAAAIFYNEAITIDPDSPTANEAREGLEKIRAGILAPRTPVDWLFGRYEPPSDLVYAEDAEIEGRGAEGFQIEATEAMLETPGTEVVEDYTPGQPVEAYEGLAPVAEPFWGPDGPLDDTLLTPVEVPDDTIEPMQTPYSDGPAEAEGSQSGSDSQ